MAPGRASMTLLHATWPECPPMLWSAVRMQTWLTVSGKCFRQP
uniref:Uncharacterized protein n=1 Tax=Anguilla anguilla TaxID=7936 RepID=A0A0E9QHN8_ANGAN